MTRAEELRSLRERVLAATEPDRALDAAIINAVAPSIDYQSNTDGFVTGSLDAAVALCERLDPSRPTQGPIQSRSPWVGYLKAGIAMMGSEGARLRRDFGPSDLPRFVVAACLTTLIERETGDGH